MPLCYAKCSTYSLTKIKKIHKSKSGKEKSCITSTFRHKFINRCRFSDLIYVEKWIMLCIVDITDQAIICTYLITGRTSFSIIKCSSLLRLDKWASDAFSSSKSFLYCVYLSRAPHSGSCQLISDKVLPCPELFAFYKKLLKQNNIHIPQISH